MLFANDENTNPNPNRAYTPPPYTKVSMEEEPMAVNLFGNVNDSTKRYTHQQNMSNERTTISNSAAMIALRARNAERREREKKEAVRKMEEAMKVTQNDPFLAADIAANNAARLEDERRESEQVRLRGLALAAGNVNMDVERLTRQEKMRNELFSISNSEEMKAARARNAERRRLEQEKRKDDDGKNNEYGGRRRSRRRIIKSRTTKSRTAKGRTAKSRTAKSRTAKSRTAKRVDRGKLRRTKL